MMGGEPLNNALPIVVKLPTIEPEPGEPWVSYRYRVEQTIQPTLNLMNNVMGLDSVPLLAANALQTTATTEQIEMLSSLPEVSKLELDPVVQVVLLDDAANDLLLGSFRTKHPTLTGSGVKVAVLDSGVDTQHPFLSVSDSLSTSGEDVAIPGKHGTHCAGIIASRDSIFSGVAPDVELVNIKVVKANGTGKHTNIMKGIDRALDRDVDVISMSLGFNHLPTWSNKGHGWTCTQGDCPLCTAVDTAVALENVIVVAAAGNEHDRAEALRASGFGNKFDTELTCPGQARRALTVGALTKNTFLLASFSSRGPTSFNDPKPILCAPGVNITSTVPAPRTATGTLVNNPPRASLFGRSSGTSMATPFVAGTTALLIQEKKAAGLAWTPSTIIGELLMRGLIPVVGTANEVGGGRLTLGKL
jgi:subtilisin family serine protease